MTVKPATPWSRFLVEGVVIVAGILLAFGIDAWWDDRTDRQVTREHLEAIRIEMPGNERFLDEQAAYRAQVPDVTAALLSHMGPTPELVSSDSRTVLHSGSGRREELKVLVSGIDGELSR